MVFYTGNICILMPNIDKSNKTIVMYLTYVLHKSMFLDLTMASKKNDWMIWMNEVQPKIFWIKSVVSSAIPNH